MRSVLQACSNNGSVLANGSRVTRTGCWHSILAVWSLAGESRVLPGRELGGGDAVRKGLKREVVVTGCCGCDSLDSTSMIMMHRNATNASQRQTPTSVFRGPGAT